MEIKVLKRENDELNAQLQSCKEAVHTLVRENEQLKQQQPQAQADPNTIPVEEVRSRLTQIQDAGKWRKGKVLGRISGLCKNLLEQFLSELGDDPNSK
ncbi:MAG: hypothetical protein AAF383_02185 [Cyanobacteria bacterium P01_A01_bin.83]